MKKLFIILGSIAIVLGIVAYFAVFAPGTYELTPSSTQPASSGTLSFGSLAGDTGSSSTSGGGSSSSSTAGSAFASSTNGGFATNYAYPYIVNWGEQQNSFSITGAALQGNQIVFGIKVQIGNVGGCVPLDLRLVTDESGDLAPPDQAQFDFPDSHSCTGSPNANYTNQIVTFTVSPTTPTPYLFTTGGSSNQFFEVATTTGNGVQITLPSNSG